MSKITVVGSQGTADFNEEGWRVSPFGTGYPEIMRLDVAEWKRTYHDDPSDQEHDVLDFGYWTYERQYVEPNFEWRKELSKGEL